MVNRKYNVNHLHKNEKVQEQKNDDNVIK